MGENLKNEMAVPEISSITKKCIAELIGTMVLVFLGCGSAVFSVFSASPIGTIGIAFAFGLSLLVMVYAVGSISGCHINPAVSISMLVAGKISVKNALLYIVSQFMGAIIGAALLYWIVSGSPFYNITTIGLGANQYSTFSTASVFVAEVVMTFIFLLVIHGSTSEKAPKGFAGVAIGFSLVLIHLVTIPIDGTSVNPARSLGPAILVGGTALSQLWLFLVAPIIGGILAALVWKAIK